MGSAQRPCKECPRRAKVCGSLEVRSGTRAGRRLRNYDRGPRTSAFSNSRKPRLSIRHRRRGSSPSRILPGRKGFRSRGKAGKRQTYRANAKRNAQRVRLPRLSEALWHILNASAGRPQRAAQSQARVILSNWTAEADLEAEQNADHPVLLCQARAQPGANSTGNRHMQMLGAVPCATLGKDL